MAGEKKGKAYEALVKLALEQLKWKGVLSESIFWDEKPDGMSIVPDLTIGVSKDEPHILLLITHSGAAGNSHMKTWRNMGELAEAKVCLPNIPRVFNIAFDSVIKENLKLALAASFDGQLLVGDLDYGKALQDWIDQNLKRFPKEKEAKVTFLDAESKSDKILKKLLKQFTDDLDKLLKQRASAELDALWTMERQRKHVTRVPRARNTFARRGLSKLLIFEDIDVALRLYSGQRVAQTEIPGYAYDLLYTVRGAEHGPLAGLAMGRATPTDEEISNAVSLLGYSTAKYLLRKAPLGKIEGWLVSLRNIPHLRVIGDYIYDHYDQLCDSAILAKQLSHLHKDPSALVKDKSLPANWPPQNIWLFEVLLELSRLDEDNSTAYGYAQLERDCEKIVGMPRAGDPIYRMTIPGWVHRRIDVALPTKVLDGICVVISNKLSNIGKKRVKELLTDEALKKLLGSIIETKLCTYRLYEPLKLLIEHTTPRCTSVSYRSCFGERAGLGGQATKTTILQKGKTLINWQSAHSTHTKDKKKELCGRAVSLRYTWDAKNRKFVARPSVAKLILVVDGTWSRDDLNALARAGWDEIYYPDDMGELAKAIV
jgi:hypothetical protein